MFSTPEHVRGRTLAALWLLLFVVGAVSASGQLPAYAQTRDLANGTAYGTAPSFVLADFNGDGIPDLAAAGTNQSAVVAVSLGDPGHRGQFLPPVFYPIPFGSIDTVTAVDYDGDGRVDLIAAGSGVINLLRNNPAKPGTFLPAVTVSAPPVFALGDFTRHGLPDLIGSSGANAFSTVQLYGNSTATGGTYTYVADIPAGIQTLHAAQAADVNGDGFPDLILTGEQTPGVLVTSVLLADPTQPGKFLPPIIYPDNPSSTCLADLNRDGLPDLVSAVLTGVIVRLNDPKHPGTFLAPVVYPANNSATLACGDVDGDGRIDVVTGSGNAAPATQNQLQILRGNGDGTLQAPVTLTTGPTAPAWQSAALLIADLDGDGLADIVSAGLQQNALQFFLHTPGTGSAAPLIRTATDLTSTPANVVSPGQTLVLTATETATSGTPTGTVDFYDSGTGTSFAPVGTATITGSNATLSIPNPAVGPHNYVAAFHGDSTFAPSQSVSVAALAAAGGLEIPFIVFTGTTPSAFGQVVTLDCGISHSSATPPTGTAQFVEGPRDLGSSSVVYLARNGSAAMLSISTLSVGVHSIQAFYSGDQNYAPGASRIFNITVLGVASQAVLATAPNPAGYAAPVTMSVVVSSQAAGLTGSVTFMDGTNALGTTPVSSIGAASLTATLAPGSHSLTAVYAGDSAHAATTSNVVVEVVAGQPTSLSLTPNPSPAAAFQLVALTAQVAPVGTPTGLSMAGTVSYYANGALLGTAAANSAGTAVLMTSALAAGMYTLTASYAPGTAQYTPSTSAAAPLTVIPDATTTSIQVTPNPAGTRQTVTYTISVKPTLSVRVPDGVVTLLDGGRQAGSGVVTAQGLFTGTLTGLALGTHVLTAAYAGSANFKSSSSTGLPLVCHPAGLYRDTPNPCVTFNQDRAPRRE